MLKPSAVVELVMQDETGSTAAVTLHAPSSATYAEIDASATALASILLPLTGAVLVRQRIKYVAVPDSPVSADNDTAIVRTGLFFFSTGTTTSDTGIMVPAVKDAIISTTEPTAGVGIDLTNSDVIAFEDAVIASGVTNPFGDAIEALFVAYLQSRV